MNSKARVTGVVEYAASVAVLKAKFLSRVIKEYKSEDALYSQKEITHRKSILEGVDDFDRNLKKKLMNFSFKK